MILKPWSRLYLLLPTWKFQVSITSRDFVCKPFHWSLWFSRFQLKPKSVIASEWTFLQCDQYQIYSNTHVRSIKWLKNFPNDRDHLTKEIEQKIRIWQNIYNNSSTRICLSVTHTNAGHKITINMAKHAIDLPISSNIRIIRHSESVITPSCLLVSLKH